MAADFPFCANSIFRLLMTVRSPLWMMSRALIARLNAVPGLNDVIVYLSLASIICTGRVCMYV